jgi:hypothetical protein
MGLVIGSWRWWYGAYSASKVSSPPPAALPCSTAVSCSATSRWVMTDVGIDEDEIRTSKGYR